VSDAAVSGSVNGAEKKDGPSTGSGRTESVGAVAVMESGALKAALGSVIAAVERRNTIPILSNVALAFGAMQKLEVTATNLDMEVRRSVPAKVSGESWSTTVCAHTLKGVADKMAAGSEVTLTLKDGRLAVVSGRARFSLPVLPIDDFPIMAGVTGTGGPLAQFDMAGAELLAMISAVEHAVSTEDTRYYLNGIYVERAEAELLFVSTDGHRLACAVRAAPDGSEVLPELGGVIIPRACLGVVKALCAEARVDVAISSNRISIEAGEVVMTSKLIDGQFPDWRRVVPGSNDKIVEVDPKLLAEAVGRVSVVASDKTRAVKLAVDADRITLTVTSPENGTASEEISASYAGAPVEVGFNGTYLSAVLGRFSGDAVSMALHDAAAPALLTSGAAKDKHVLMPMRV